jgi:mannitol/fructose-specific phosphotransferase system IIA component (Ntr-type)
MSTEPLFSAGRIRLDLAAPDRDAALRATAGLLSGDARVGPWDDFWSSIGHRQVVDLADCAGHVMIAHGRGKSVAALALSAARWSGPEGPCLVFVFAIPAAMSGEYLRKVGALARICREPGKLEALVSAATPEDFAALLEEWMA